MVDMWQDMRALVEQWELKYNSTPADAAAAFVVSSPGGGSNVFWLEDPAKSIVVPSECGDGGAGGAATSFSFTATNEEGRFIAAGTTKNGGIDMSDR